MVLTFSSSCYDGLATCMIGFLVFSNMPCFKKCAVIFYLLEIDHQGEEAPEYVLNSFELAACDSESTGCRTATTVGNKMVILYSGFYKSANFMVNVIYILQDLIAFTCMFSM